MRRVLSRGGAFAGFEARRAVSELRHAQVTALLAAPTNASGVPRIGVLPWNTNLAPYLQADEWSGHRSLWPLAMRDTDLAWTTKIVAVSGGPLAALADLRNRTLALGSRDSGHAAILPVHFLEQHGLTEGREYRALRFDSDVGKHGDTGTSEVEVVRAVLDGRADAGAIGSPFWNVVQTERLVPEGALTEIWTSPPYNHCMFTARPGLDPGLARRFVEALSGMSYDNPIHRSGALDAEGLHHWVLLHHAQRTAYALRRLRRCGLFRADPPTGCEGAQRYRAKASWCGAGYAFVMSAMGGAPLHITRS